MCRHQRTMGSLPRDAHRSDDRRPARDDRRHDRRRRVRRRGRRARRRRRHAPAAARPRRGAPRVQAPRRRARRGAPLDRRRARRARRVRRRARADRRPPPSTARARELGTTTLCWEVPHHVDDAIVAGLVEGTVLAGYRFDRYRNHPEDDGALEALLLSAHHDVSEPVAIGTVVAEAQNRARDLQNRPATRRRRRSSPTARTSSPARPTGSPSRCSASRRSASAGWARSPPSRRAPRRRRS